MNAVQISAEERPPLPKQTQTCSGRRFGYSPLWIPYSVHPLCNRNIWWSFQSLRHRENQRCLSDPTRSMGQVSVSHWAPLPLSCSYWLTGVHIAFTGEEYTQESSPFWSGGTMHRISQESSSEDPIMMAFKKPEALNQISDSSQWTLASKADWTTGCTVWHTQAPSATRMNVKVCLRGRKERCEEVFWFCLFCLFSCFVLFWSDF